MATSGAEWRLCSLFTNYDWYYRVDVINSNASVRSNGYLNGDPPLFRAAATVTVTLTQCLQKQLGKRYGHC